MDFRYLMCFALGENNASVMQLYPFCGEPHHLHDLRAHISPPSEHSQVLRRRAHSVGPEIFLSISEASSLKAVIENLNAPLLVAKILGYASPFNCPILIAGPLNLGAWPVTPDSKLPRNLPNYEEKRYLLSTFTVLSWL